MIDRASLEALIRQELAANHLPGLSLALIDGGEIVYMQGFGYRDLVRRLPLTAHTLVGVGSVTKSLTALAIMQLQERGALHIDDPLEQHLPLTLQPFGEGVRLRHLLSHSSGIPGLGLSEAQISSSLGVERRGLPLDEWADIIAFMQGADAWARARPGERFFYLNEGYQLLSAIIERVSGQSFGEYLREAVFAPLGMERSFVSAPPGGRGLEIATPYLVDEHGRCAPGRYTHTYDGAGGLITSVEDLARYVAFYLAAGAGQSRSLLSPAGLAAMLTPQIALEAREGPAAAGPAYGYGLEIVPDFHGHTLVEHGGGIRIASAYIGFIPERGLGVALMANALGPTSSIGRQALALALGLTPGQPAEPQAPDISGLVGVYESYRGTVQLTIARRGAFLYALSRFRYEQDEQPLVPIGLEGDTFRFYTLEDGERVPFDFSIREDGIELMSGSRLYRHLRPM